MTPYDPSADVIEVGRGPKPGGLGGAYRVFGETLRGLKTTLGRVVEGPVTLEYPEEKTPVYPRFRGRHKLHRFEDTGLEKCVGCSLCAAACPAECIRVVAAENTPDKQVSAGERYAAVYEINMTRCIFCGYCEVACRSTRSPCSRTTSSPTTSAATCCSPRRCCCRTRPSARRCGGRANSCRCWRPSCSSSRGS